MEASGTGAWSVLSLWYVSTETFTLTDYNEYKVDISRDKKLHEHHAAFNSSLCPWKLSQDQKALVWLIQRAAQVDVSLEIRRISLPRKNIKHLWEMYNHSCSSVEMQRGLYIRLVQQCRARFSPGTGRAGSAKPSGGAAERSHLAVLRVVRAFNLFRTSLSLCSSLETRHPAQDIFAEVARPGEGRRAVPHTTLLLMPSLSHPAHLHSTLLQWGEQGLPFCQKAVCCGPVPIRCQPAVIFRCKALC